MGVTAKGDGLAIALRQTLKYLVKGRLGRAMQAVVNVTMPSA
ncbi:MULTISPECIES: hypothetical protein [unclassified Leptolyngbya]|nr:MULTISPECIES: hypothetical protein [unclassified Leptolyngbya]